VPCWIYLRADAEAVVCREAPDVIIHRIEAAPGGFIPIELAPIAHDDQIRTGYVLVSEVVAVLPMHPRQYESELDDPPDWYTR
jgi:hypothetical protein